VCECVCTCVCVCICKRVCVCAGGVLAALSKHIAHIRPTAKKNNPSSPLCSIFLLQFESTFEICSFLDVQCPSDTELTCAPQHGQQQQRLTKTISLVSPVIFFFWKLSRLSPNTFCFCCPCIYIYMYIYIYIFIGAYV